MSAGTTQAAASLPEIEIGELTRLPPGFTDRTALVACLPHRLLAIAHDDATGPQAAQLLEAMALQLMLQHARQVPAPGTASSGQRAPGVNLALFEPAPSARFAHLKRLLARTGKSYGVQLVGHTAYHQHLQTLTDLAHQRFALLANLDVPDWTAYNTHSRVRRPDAWHILVVGDVLAESGREGDLGALQNLCMQGPQVGIVPLLLRSPAELAELQLAHARKPLHTFWQAVWPLAFGFDWRGAPPRPVNQFGEYWRSLNRFGVQVGVPPARMQTWVDELVSQQSQVAQAAELPDFLSVPIGDEGNEVVRFSMGPASRISHAMVGGTTESGKTTLVHNVLLGAAEALSPEQLHFWIIDPSGRGFRIYHQLPHTRFLHCALNFDERLYAALQLFEAQWVERTRLLNEADVDDIAQYNAQPGRCMARSLLVVDEAHNALNDRRVMPLVGRIASEGRKCGLHLILLTQSYQGLPFDNRTRDQIRLRIGCQMGASASRNLLEHENEAAAGIENSEGVRWAIVNADGGHPAANRKVHLYPLSREARVDRVAALARRYPGRSPPIEPVLPEPAPGPALRPPSGRHASPGGFDPGDLTAG